MLRSGMSAQGYFDGEGEWIPAKELVGIDASGKEVAFVPSTLGEAQPLEGPLPAEKLLDLQVESVYALDAIEVGDDLAAALGGGEVFSFPFNYRGDYQAEQAFLIGNEDGYFALVGQVAEPEWSALEVIAPPDFDEEADDDDIDFEMM